MDSPTLRVKARATETSDGSEEEPPVSPRSAMFLEKGFDVHVVALIGLKAPLDVDVLKDNIPNTILQQPRFSSLVVNDPSKREELRWVRQDNVDPLNYIIVPEIGPEAATDPDKYLEDYVYNLSKSGVDRSMRLWEIHVINLKTSHSEAVAVFRFHHCLGDGTSLISLLLACTRQVADPTAVPTVPTTRTHKQGTRKENKTVVARWRGLLMAICVMMELWWNTVVDVATFIATSFYLKDTGTSFNGGSKTVEYLPGVSI